MVVNRASVRTGSVWCQPVLSGFSRFCLVSTGSVWCQPVLSGVNWFCLLSTSYVK